MSLESLFEDEPVVKAVPATPSRYSFPDFSSKPVIPLALTIFGALCLIWFGASTSGTFYGPASGKFSGLLATIFYQYQAGTMIEFSGIWVLLGSIREIFKK